MSPRQKTVRLPRGFMVDAMCGFDSLNTCRNQILGELKCVSVVDVV